MVEMKVLVLSNMYPSEQAKSFGIFVKNQVDALKKRGHQVKVIAIRDSRMGMTYAIPKYFKWFSKGIATLLAKGRSFDVVHAHYVFPTGLLGLLFKQVAPIRLVVTAHGGDLDRMARKNKWIFALTKKILQKADHVIAVGDQLKKDIETDFSIPSHKITVLNMGVNRHVFAPMDKAMAKKHLGLDLESKHFLFIGNIIRAKGVEELLKAFGQVLEVHPNVCLHLIGLPKDQAFAESMKRESQKIGDGMRVHFYPPVSQKELAKWMNAGDCFILPSHIEGFGLVALEAMSCRTPVIGTAVGGLKMLLDDGCGVLVPPKEVAPLRQAIMDFLDAPQAFDHQVQKAEAQADRYSEDKIMDRLSEIYQSEASR